MADITFETKGVQDPHDKPRVYFTCHPLDFNRVFKEGDQPCFDKICNDIFSIIDCAIYYTKDMQEALDEDDLERLGNMKLFVVPVTNRLLLDSNRAMNVDIAFAKEHNISVLPIMMEPVSENLYSNEKNFGKCQHINPFSTDVSEVSYVQKLTRFIKEILVDKELSDKIKKAFQRGIPALD